MKPLSIRHRLSLSLAFSLSLVFVLLGIGVSVSFQWLTESYLHSRLEHDQESLLAALQSTPEGGFQLRAERMNPIYSRPFSGHYYRIQAADQVLRSRSLWDQELAVPTVAVGQSIQFRQHGPEQQLLLVLVAGYRKAGHDFSIAVAEDLTPTQIQVRQFQISYALFGLSVLALLLLLQRWILNRGLRPLAESCAEIDQLERGERQQLNELVPIEMQPMVRQVNHLSTSLEQRLLRSRHALGNLAHALKTPLTLLAQLTDRDELFKDPQQALRMRELVERIRLLTDRELKRARLAGAASRTSRIDLVHELQALAAVVQQLHPASQCRIELLLPDTASIQADREDMHELFGNLLDNACKWARSRVQLRMQRKSRAADDTAADWSIYIEDDGPGCDPTALARLNQRGVRLDEQAVPGHGLGLAIAQDIVDHYGWQLSLQTAPELGGFSAEVQIPAASSRV